MSRKRYTPEQIIGMLRDVEAVTAQVRVLMKSRTLGKYSDTCWHAEYIIDTEFEMKREPFVASCDDGPALEVWQGQHAFKTRWDLGLNTQ